MDSAADGATGDWILGDSAFRSLRCLEFIRAAYVRLIVLGLWISFLTFLAVLPTTPRVPWISDSTASAGGHIVTTAALAALLYWVFFPGPVDRRGRIQHLLVVVGLTIGAVVALELVQGLFSDSRTFQGFDILSGSIGAISVAMVLMVLAEVGFPRRFISIATLVVLAAMSGSVFASLVAWNPAYPYRGDHWHAQYIVVVCGDLLPPFSGFYGSGLSSSGDHVVHIRPTNSDEEGANPNLGRILSLVGGELTNTRITLPSGETYSNGDECPGGSTGELRAFDYDPGTRLRGARIEDLSSYVPRNRQTLVIEFWAPAG